MEQLNKAKVDELIAGYDMKQGISVSVAEEGFGQVLVQFQQGDKGARWRSNYPNAEARLVELLEYAGVKKVDPGAPSIKNELTDDDKKVVGEINAMLLGIAEHHGLPSGVTLSVDTESSTNPVIKLKDNNANPPLLGQIQIKELSLDRAQVIEPMAKKLSELLQRVFPNDDQKLVNLRNQLAEVANNRESLSLTGEQYAASLVDVMRSNGVGNSITSEELMAKIDSNPVGHCLAKALSSWRTEEKPLINNQEEQLSPGVEMQRRVKP
tara:strand:- start:10729 stop:11529 length:801 start_codon:yes stop_codon:yes gene_type:complete